MASGIFIPQGVTVAYTCACGAKFFHKERGIRHAATCTRADDELAAELADKESSPITSTKPADAEAWDWGRKRIAEGKPGFKAGRPT